MRQPEPCALTLQEKLELELSNAIAQGIFAPGEKIPTEHELAASHGVSRVTVRGALKRLVERGLLVKRQGKGTYVRPSAHVESTLSTGSFTETCLEAGCMPSTRIVGSTVRTADEGTSKILELDERSEGKVMEIRRLRLVDGAPCIVEDDTIPWRFSFLLETPLENRSLFSLLEEEGGCAIAGFEDQFGITSATAELAELLEIKRGDPVLEVTETVVDMDGRTLYMNRQFIATERYTYAVRSFKK
ncbi:MAG: GntR family transcriptional regulator [Collinsella sp.]|nr:GntR family transcriptional regulator [Collinsella sp.]